jgi:GH35 family endo-1,4-beta-xylanase
MSNEHARSGTDSEESTSDQLNRREYMQVLGGLGAISALGGFVSRPATAETADTSQTIDARIQEHRTGRVEVVVETADGSAVSNADVSITQQEHDFGFGTAVNANTLINNSNSGDNYRTYIPKLFNKAVIENRTKWAFWEEQRQLADEAVYWLLDQGLDVRGHVCIWGRDGVSAIPDDIQTAIDNRNGQYIRERSMQHIEDIITHYGDDLTEWEIVNEAMHVYQLQLGVYGDQINTDQPWTGEVVPWTSDLLADWYSQAASVINNNGLDLGIAVNDFNQFAYAYTDNRYETEINHINGAVQLDTVGLQAHVAARTGQFNTNNNPDGRISASQVVDEINKWADHGARVKITEFDTYGGNDWNSDQERADVLENYLRGAFSHPGVDDFIMWGFWDGRHWKNEAPLFYRDWSKKPAYGVWTGLIFDEWWTDETGTTDGSGTYTIDAFLGDHEITVETGSGSITKNVSLTDPNGTTTVTVTTKETGTDLAPINGAIPTDPDGDGSYEDINGNGQIDFDDMVTYFEHMDEPVITDYDAYDFNGNGQIDFDDLVALFQEQ